MEQKVLVNLSSAFLIGQVHLMFLFCRVTLYVLCLDSSEYFCLSPVISMRLIAEDGSGMMTCL